MNTLSILAGGFAAATLLACTGPAAARIVPQQQEIMTAPGTQAPLPSDGPQWRAFSRGASSLYLIDPASVSRDGGETHISVARVPAVAPPGDYSHIVDGFAILCDADQSRVKASAEAYEDGELGEAVPADEPWGDIRAGSFDEGVQQIACGDASPVAAPFPSIRAYIDAGRP